MVERAERASVPVGWGDPPADASASAPPVRAPLPPEQRPTAYPTFHERRRRRPIVPLVAGGAVLLAAALLYGLTRAPGMPTPVPVVPPPLATPVPAATQAAAAVPTAVPTDTPAPIAAAPTVQPTSPAATAAAAPASPTSASAAPATAAPAATTTAAAPAPAKSTAAAAPDATAVARAPGALASGAPTPGATAAAQPTTSAAIQPTAGSPAATAAAGATGIGAAAPSTTGAGQPAASAAVQPTAATAAGTPAAARAASPTAAATAAGGARPAASADAGAIRFGPPIRLQPRDDTFAVLATNTTQQPKRVVAAMTLRRASGEVHTARGEIASLMPGQTRLLPLRSTAGPLPSLYETIDVRVEQAQDAAPDPLAADVVVGQPTARHTASNYGAEITVENKGATARTFELHVAFAGAGKPLAIAIWSVTNLGPGERRVVRPTADATGDQPDAIHAWPQAG